MRFLFCNIGSVGHDTPAYVAPKIEVPEEQDTTISPAIEKNKQLIELDPKKKEELENHLLYEPINIKVDPGLNKIKGLSPEIFESIMKIEDPVLKKQMIELLPKFKELPEPLGTELLKIALEELGKGYKEVTINGRTSKAFAGDIETIHNITTLLNNPDITKILAEEGLINKEMKPADIAKIALALPYYEMGFLFGERTDDAMTQFRTIIKELKESYKQFEKLNCAELPDGSQLDKMDILYEMITNRIKYGDKWSFKEQLKFFEKQIKTTNEIIAQTKANLELFSETFELSLEDTAKERSSALSSGFRKATSEEALKIWLIENTIGKDRKDLCDEVLSHPDMQKHFDNPIFKNLDTKNSGHIKEVVVAYIYDYVVLNVTTRTDINSEKVKIGIMSILSHMSDGEIEQLYNCNVYSDEDRPLAVKEILDNVKKIAFNDKDLDEYIANIIINSNITLDNTTKARIDYLSKESEKNNKEIAELKKLSILNPRQEAHLRALELEQSKIKLELSKIMDDLIDKIKNKRERVKYLEGKTRTEKEEDEYKLLLKELSNDIDNASNLMPVLQKTDLNQEAARLINELQITASVISDNQIRAKIKEIITRAEIYIAQQRLAEQINAANNLQTQDSTNPEITLILQSGIRETVTKLSEILTRLLSTERLKKEQKEKLEELRLELKDLEEKIYALHSKENINKIQYSTNTSQLILKMASIVETLKDIYKNEPEVAKLTAEAKLAALEFDKITRKNQAEKQNLA